MLAGTYRPLPELPSIESTNLTNFPVLQVRHRIVSRGESEVVKDHHTTAERQQKQEHHHEQRCHHEPRYHHEQRCHHEQRSQQQQ